MNDWRKPCEHGVYVGEHSTSHWSQDKLAYVLDESSVCPGGSPVTAADLEGLGLRAIAREEWEANFNLGRIERATGWDHAIWLDYLAARTEYIVRQLLIPIPDPQEVEA